ncbi:HdeD family acid-resistance protein [Ruminococcus gauvreauii]|uniref:HdeD family acid-resistance protein n=1 Tax=Ruminococcus gauvreauii TaxID=438033 RepID=UPI003984222D
MKRFVKEFKRDYMIMALMCIVVGILFLFFPVSSGKIICYMIAILFGVIGVIHIVIYFRKAIDDYIFQMDFARGLMEAACGVFFLIMPELLLGILPIALGILVIVDCFVKIQHGTNLMRMGYEYWWVVMLLGIAAGVLGIFMLFNPFGTMKALMIFIGIALIADGLMDFWTLFCVSGLLKRISEQVLEEDIVLYDDEQD